MILVPYLLAVMPAVHFRLQILRLSANHQRARPVCDEALRDWLCRTTGVTWSGRRASVLTSRDGWRGSCHHEATMMTPQVDPPTFHSTVGEVCGLRIEIRGHLKR